MGGGGGKSVLKNQFQGAGGGSVLRNQFEGGGGVELSDQLFDPDAPTLASQDKLKVSPKGLPFVTSALLVVTRSYSYLSLLISLVLTTPHRIAPRGSNGGRTEPNSPKAPIVPLEKAQES